MSMASGHSRRISSARSSTKGMVRSPRKMPPIPIESAMVCFRPYFLGISKSVRVASCIPIWTMFTTKSAPSSALRRSRCSSTFASAPSRSEVQRAIMPAVCRRSGSMSCSEISAPCSSGKLRVSVMRFLVKTTLPAPIKAILVIWVPLRCRIQVRLLQARAGDPLNEVALEEDEDQQYRHNRDQRHTHEASPVRVVLTFHEAQAQSDGVGGAVLEHDQGPREVVPAPHEREDRQHRYHGPRERKDDPAEDREFPRAVEPGRLYQLVRDADHELPDHEDAERLRRPRDEHPPVGVDPPELGDYEELGDHDDLYRDHERADQEEEEHVTAPEPVLGEGVAAKEVDEHRHDNRDDGDGEGVYVELREGQLAP